VKLKRHGGGKRRYKRLLRRRKSPWRMHLDRSADNIERYKVTKKTATRAVSEAMGQMYDGLYQQLGTKK
jgi:hypothetical protein